MSDYTEQTTCLFCDCDMLQPILTTSYQIPLGCYVVPTSNHPGVSMPFQVMNCPMCHTHQLRYFGNPDIIYNYEANSHGSIRSSMNEVFSKFVTQDSSITSILEIGAGHGDLADQILSINSNLSYTIIDPTYSGTENQRTIIRSFIEKIPKESIHADTIVMSHVFEHFYKPNAILKLFQETPSIQTICLNMPDLDAYIQQGNYHVLNPEHIYYIEREFLMALFEKHGFKTEMYSFHENHSVFYRFRRFTPIPNDTCLNPLKNIHATTQVSAFFEAIQTRIQTIQTELDKHPERPFYIWPCSMHTTYLLSLGLDPNRVTAILDNAPHKIGQYLYGFQKECQAFSSVLKTTQPIFILLNGGCYNAEIQTSTQNPNITWL